MESNVGMRMVYATMDDNTRTLLFVTDHSFDVEKWIKSREWAIRKLGVNRITVEDM